MTGFAVVTVIHDSASELERLLASIERFLRPPPELIVVDSGSTDAGAEVARAAGARGRGARRQPRLRRGQQCRPGSACPLPVTALLNPDTELLDDGLVKLVAEAATRNALLVPRLLNADGSVQDSAHPLPGTVEALIPAALPRPLLPGPLRRRYEPWRSSRPRPVGWAIAACVVARTDLLRRAGPFDPGAFLFYEDLELCLRAADLGAPTLLRPSVSVRHLGGTSVARALGDDALALAARRRREVVAGISAAALWRSTTSPRPSPTARGR